MWICVRHPAIVIFLTALVVAIINSARRAIFARSRPISIDVQNTILVVLVIGPDSPRSKVDEIFRTADVPSRVRVAVYCDEGEPQFSPAHQQSVRVARNMQRTMAFSASAARAWLLRHMFRSERFTLLCPPDVQLCNSWDTRLLHMLEDHPEPDYALLTTQCHPPDIASEARTRLPSFLCLGAMRGARLDLLARRVTTPPGAGEVIPSLFWSPSFSFCRSDVLQHCPLATGASDTMEATLNSIRLYTHGYSFYAPSQTVAWCNGPGPVSRQKTREAVPAPGKVRTLRQFEEFAGVSFSRSTAAVRARLGLTSAPNVSECTIKYGSLEDTRVALGAHPDDTH